VGLAHEGPAVLLKMEKHFLTGYPTKGSAERQQTESDLGADYSPLQRPQKVGTTFTLPLPCPTWFIKGACGWWLARLVFKGSMDSTKERVPNWLSARAQRRGSRQMPIYQFSPESSMFAYIKRCLLPKKKKNAYFQSA